MNEGKFIAIAQQLKQPIENKVRPSGVWRAVNPIQGG
jgi:hypothetical protein